MIRSKFTFALLYFAAACAWAGNPIVQPAQNSTMQAHPYQPPSRYSYAPATRTVAPVMLTLTVTQPASNPYVSWASSLTISGTCSGVSPINLAATGQTSPAANTSIVCPSTGYYHFPPIQQSSAGTYTYIVFANDSHGAPFKKIPVVWERRIPPGAAVTRVPVTLTRLTLSVPSPYNPYVSTNPSLTISGTCMGVTEVNLAATGQTSPTDNKSVACTGGKYVFPLLYKTKPDTYTYAVFANDAHSSPIGRFDITWIHGQAPVGIQPR